MYYKDVEEESFQPGYEFGRAEVMTWMKSPVGIIAGISVVILLIFIIWWFFIRSSSSSSSTQAKFHY